MWRTYAGRDEEDGKGRKDKRGDCEGVWGERRVGRLGDGFRWVETGGRRR